MATFNRSKAREYALKWALGRNPDYPDFSTQGHGGDCANFVSQCLFAGGSPLYAVGGHGWWGSKNSTSLAWNRAEFLRRHIRSSAWATRCKRNELWWGDIVFGLIKGGVVHAMIVTQVQRIVHPTAQNYVYMCGHSNDRLNYELPFVESFYGMKNVEYCKVADTIRLR